MYYLFTWPSVVHRGVLKFRAIARVRMDTWLVDRPRRLNCIQSLWKLYIHRNLNARWFAQIIYAVCVYWHLTMGNPSQYSGKATDWMTEFRLTAEQDFFFATTTRPALWPTQPAVQWISGFSSRGKISRGVKLTTHHLVSRLRKCGAIHLFLQTPAWRGA
jgi:hypothetical protein